MYEDFFTNELWTGALLNSVVIGVAATVLASVLGTTAALGLHGSRLRAKPWIVGLAVRPLAVPVVITAVASFYFLAALHLVGTYAGLVLIHTVPGASLRGHHGDRHAAGLRRHPRPGGRQPGRTGPAMPSAR